MSRSLLVEKIHDRPEQVIGKVIHKLLHHAASADFCGLFGLPDFLIPVFIHQVLGERENRQSPQPGVGMLANDRDCCVNKALEGVSTVTCWRTRLRRNLLIDSIRRSGNASLYLMFNIASTSDRGRPGDISEIYSSQIRASAASRYALNSICPIFDVRLGRVLTLPFDELQNINTAGANHQLSESLSYPMTSAT
jgi:hypothetical protein